MNKVFLMGRLTKDPEVRYTNTGKVVAQFTIAVDRPYVNPETNQREADFFPVVIWGKPAETAGNSLLKGQRVLVEGRVQIRSYEPKDGSAKRWITEVIADRFEFIERKDQWERRDGTPAMPKPDAAGVAPAPAAPQAEPAPSVNMGGFGTAVADDEKIPF